MDSANTLLFVGVILIVWFWADNSIMYVCVLLFSFKVSVGVILIVWFWADNIDIDIMYERTSHTFQTWCGGCAPCTRTNVPFVGGVFCFSFFFFL